MSIPTQEQVNTGVFAVISNSKFCHAVGVKKNEPCCFSWEEATALADAVRNNGKPCIVTKIKSLVKDDCGKVVGVMW